MTNITEEKNSPFEPIGCYGITITFRKPLEQTTKPFNQYLYTSVYLSKIFGESCIDFILMPEFQISGRIHYHGTLKIKNFPRWIKTTLPRIRKLGYCKIETFKEPENRQRWTQYMFKSKEDTKQILGVTMREIGVTKQDYLEWKTKEPTIETFIRKGYCPPPTKVNTIVCELGSNGVFDYNYVIDYVDENGVTHFKHVI